MFRRFVDVSSWWGAEDLSQCWAFRQRQIDAVYVLGGLTHADTGRVLVDGADFSAMSDAERTKLRKTKIGFVFQKFNLLPTLDAQTNIKIAQNIAGNKIMTIRNIWRNDAAAGDLKRMVHRPGRTFRRRTTARGTGARADQQACDRARRRTYGQSRYEEFRCGAEPASTINKDLGQTVLMITHNPEAAAYADRAIHMRDGEIVEMSAV